MTLADPSPSKSAIAARPASRIDHEPIVPPGQFAQISLTAKMVVLIGLLTVSGLGAIIALTIIGLRNEHQLSDIATTTYTDMGTTSSGRISAIVAEVNRQLALVDAVRSAQEHFHSQVLDWKSLLQRGNRPDQKDHFMAAFDAESLKVRECCATAASLIGTTAEVSSTLAKFAASYEKLLKSYHNGIGMIALADTYAEGAKAADDLMIGRDAEPQTLLDGLVIDAGNLARHAIANAAEESLTRVSTAANDGSDRIADTIRTAQTHMFILSMCVSATMLVLMLVSIIMVRFGLKPLQATAIALDAVAAGDLRRPNLKSGSDEIGRMTKALGRAMDGTRSSIDRMAQDLDIVSQAIASLKSTGIRLKSQVDRTLKETSASSASGEQIATSSEVVSASIEELAACVQEIASSCSKAATTGNKAVQSATMAEQAIADLQLRSDEIAEVTNAISEIAAQTNLLALNATIEAARAGDAGRGFAVVANEIKLLAQGTSQATSDIGGKIEAIRSVSGRAVASIRVIITQIRQLDEMVVQIAAAMEEQVATTSDVAHNMQEIASSSNDIAAHLLLTKATADSVDQETIQIGNEALRLEAVVEQQRLVIARFQR